MLKILKYFLIVLGLLVGVFWLFFNWRYLLTAGVFAGFANIFLSGGVLGSAIGVMFFGTLVFILVDLVRDVF